MVLCQLVEISSKLNNFKEKMVLSFYMCVTFTKLAGGWLCAMAPVWASQVEGYFYFSHCFFWFCQPTLRHTSIRNLAEWTVYLGFHWSYFDTYVHVSHVRQFFLNLKISWIFIKKAMFYYNVIHYHNTI